MTTIDKNAPVLVTGASGYIATWIVRILLEEGRTVHGTVRDPSKKASVAPLEKMAEELPGTLKLFKADLLSEGSFDEAAEACELVMHTASPFIISGFKDANEALVRPAVEGTRSVLNTCNKVQSVKRVVLTTSCASIYGDNCDMAQVPGGIYTEDQWNTSSSLEHQPYSYSKVQAERTAWKIAEEQRRWDLVCINPSLVMGPALTTHSQSTSIGTLCDLGSGKMVTGVPNLEFGVVDVRDVARAHILAGDTPTASGRNIVSAETRSMLEMARILREKFPKYPLPRFEAPKFMAWLMGPVSGVTRPFVSKNVGWPLKFDNSKSQRELGLEYRPFESTICEHFQQLIDDGILKKR